MSSSDLVAIYGAILATILAVLQILQGRNARKFLSIKHNEFFGNDESTIEAIIANRGQFDVTLDFVAFGYCGRYRRSPWRREALNICSISQIKGYVEDGAELGKPIDGRTLKPGELVRVGVRREQFARMQNSEGHMKVFAVRPCIWVEHSQSDTEICHLVRLSSE